MGTSQVLERISEAEPLGSEGLGSSSGAASSDRATGKPSLAGQVFRPIAWMSIVAGLVLLELAAFILWGTGMKTAAAQSQLRREFAESRQSAVPGHVWRPVNGESVGRLIIPKLGVDAIVIEGVGYEELTRGPGHIPETALPGTDGSSVISGHRSTYGAPFGDLDQLEPGDEIRIITVEGESRYSVTKAYVIFPVDTSVTLPLAFGEQPRLRLTTCHPRFSAARRLIVEADRISPPVP